MKCDPRAVVLRFNQAITDHDLAALTGLMTEDHTFIDRDGTITRTRRAMSSSWSTFFRMFPAYHNIFETVIVRHELVIMAGHAFWEEGRPREPAIWTARVVAGRVAEWRIYDDTQDVRGLLGIP